MDPRRLYGSTFSHFFAVVTIGFIYLSSCVPPGVETTESTEEAEAARLDSIRQIKCPRLMSSAAEYYKNRDWQSTVKVYKQVVELGCDKGQEEDVYQYWAIAYENLGSFDSSQYVLLRGLKRLPDNLDLHKRLAYAYKRQGNTSKEILEYEKIVEFSPEDVESMQLLSDLYNKVGRYEDQIFIIKKILEAEPDNKDAQADLVDVYEKTGRDPLDIYWRRFADNPDNLSLGLDLAEQLMARGEYEDAITVLTQMMSSGSGNSSVSTKLVLKKLATAYDRIGRLEEESRTYEQLFELDKRDFRSALEVVKINIDLLNFGKAIKWANRAIEIAPNNGECLANKGNVYFKAFQECRKDNPTTDDKVVAALAHEYFVKAEKNNYSAVKRNREWLEQYDLVFGASEWFMLDEEQKRSGSILPKGSCYEWVTEPIKKKPGW